MTKYQQWPRGLEWPYSQVPRHSGRLPRNLSECMYPHEILVQSQAIKETANRADNHQAPPKHKAVLRQGDSRPPVHLSKFPCSNQPAAIRGTGDQVTAKGASCSGDSHIYVSTLFVLLLTCLNSPAPIGPPPDSARLDLSFWQVYGNMIKERPGGEIGRRASLRCWWAQALAGSNPVPGIIFLRDQPLTIYRLSADFRYNTFGYWLRVRIMPDGRPKGR